jgi:hypothetical protein
MTPAQRDRLKELLTDILAHPLEKRSDLINACSEDAVVRAELQRLLNLHGEIGAFLERPAIPSVPTLMRQLPRS